MTMYFHRDSEIRSWGRVGSRVHDVARPRFTQDLSRWNPGVSGQGLAIGNCRSYSDICLSDGGRLIDMTGLDRFRSFDPETGVLVAEAGATIDSLLRSVVPRGFFVPVTPGTRFVTLGGAVANDVHGKNHHRAGTFGRHVRAITLERSDESTVEIGPDVRPDLFSATVGGMGLTGIITKVELKLQRITSSQVEVETTACRSLDSLCDHLELADSQFEHSVAWIDCTASGPELGRGIISRANWSDDGILRTHGDTRRSIPTDRLDWAAVRPVRSAPIASTVR